MARLRAFHLMALFILVYVGTEVTLGGEHMRFLSSFGEQLLTPRPPFFSGWIVTYVIDLRGGGPSSGYISSGFFGGTPPYS